MISAPFWIVDVFAERSFGGNPLCVVAPRERLSDETMQSLAAEMGMSETVYIHPGVPLGTGYSARIFTPTQELAFAGHPSLGAAAVYDLTDGPDDRSAVRQYDQVTSAKVVKMTVEDALGSISVRMDQGFAEFGDAVALDELGLVFDGAEGATAAFAFENGARVVSMGLPSLMYPVADAASLEALDPETVSIDALDAVGAKTLYAFTADGPTKFLARCFAGPVGVAEDPATGSAAGSLGAHLREMSPGGPEMEIQIQQGQWLNRESLIKAHAENNDKGTSVAITGGCVVLGRGEFTL